MRPLADRGIMTADTKTKIIETAERLFAERGVDGVSLREIVQAAGQRNASALQYHFKSRAGLLHAVFVHRMGPINALRLAMLDEARRSGAPMTELVLAKAIVLPLAHQLLRLETPTYYASFLAQILSSEHHFASLQGAEYYSGIRECTLQYRHLMQGVDFDLLNRRIRMAISSTVREFSIIEREIRGACNAADRDRIHREIGNVVDAVTGILASPPQASHQLDTLEKILEKPSADAPAPAPSS